MLLRNHDLSRYFWPGGIALAACTDKGGVRSEAALPGSEATQSPAHSGVPLTVPTNLQPVSAFGFTNTRGTLPTFGGTV
jgi:hypothetical protein